MSYIEGTSPGEPDPSLFDAMKDRLGFVPNFYRVQASRPDLIEAEAKLVEALVETERGLSRQQKEYIVLVCSAANLSTYCVTLHSEIVRMLGIAGPEPEQVALNHAATNLPVPLKALLNFTLKLNNQASKVASRDVEALRTYGFTDDQILEAVLMVGLAKFLNSVALGLGAVPDFEPAR